MTIGSIVEHWAYGRGVILAIEKADPIGFVQVHWNEPVEWEDDGVDVVDHVYWTDADEVIMISEAK